MRKWWGSFAEVFFIKCPDHTWFWGENGSRKSRGSRVGTSKIILAFYPVICLVRWIMGRLGKVGREMVIKFQSITKSSPDLDVLDRQVHCSRVDNSTTSSTYEDSEGPATPRSATDTTE
jgi:hypothetical protein